MLTCIYDKEIKIHAYFKSNESIQIHAYLNHMKFPLKFQ